jgi:CRP/FNR family transcriptional regulator
LYRVGKGTICLQSFACLVEGDHYTAEGVVETDVAGVLVPADAFQARLAEDAAFRAMVFKCVAQRFVEYQRLVEEVALTGFDTRLARVMLRLSDAAGLVAATHAALASETASGRAFVSRRLAQFARDGVVVQEKRGVRILDRGALERIAADDR